LSELVAAKDKSYSPTYVFGKSKVWGGRVFLYWWW
jgi:hypothetical protein